MSKIYKNLIETLEYLQADINQKDSNASKTYPIKISEYYLSLIDKLQASECPIWKQCMPSQLEIEDESSEEDALHEESQMPVDRLIHRYEDRAVILTTNVCTTHCRFCFRKRYWKQNKEKYVISDNEILNICNYLKNNRNVNEVLVSGGDPLTLPTERLSKLITQINSIKNIGVIRIATRAPVTLPSSVTQDHIDVISASHKTWIVTHYNHPIELTYESLNICRKFIKAGVPILNQTVLLKGINDNHNTLHELFRKLANNRIKPHYLFHIDPVKGVKHFATGTDIGLQIMRYLRKYLSSTATPTFAIDLPEGGGKVNLQPNYYCGGMYEGIDGRLIKYKFN